MGVQKNVNNFEIKLEQNETLIKLTLSIRQFLRNDLSPTHIDSETEYHKTTRNPR